MGERIPFDLSGKKALVTGGNTGIGLGIARGFAKAGAKVAIVGRNAKNNEAALAALLRIQPGCRQFIFDLENLEGIPGLFEEVSEQLGGVDILVNNAAVQCRGRADQIALDDFERTLRINLTAPYVLSQCFARARIGKQARGGAIIFIASLMSEASRPTTSPYTATKGAIRQLVKALAVDWAPFGIRVNGLGPGYIQTEMTRPLWEDETFSQWVVGRTPLARWGMPEDFAGAAVFLASDAARFITGQILYVDGGWLATF
jgi:gluconate 5-dehydrogenase